jgi:magnesium chelatase family protein
MLARIPTAALRGIDALPVWTEVSLTSGLPSFTVVGLAEGAVREGRERVVAALKHAGVELPHRRITVNLAPADVRKEGSAFDLSIAVGLLAGVGKVPHDAVSGWAFLGELGLDGALRPVRGVLSLTMECRRAGARGVVVPPENAQEAAVVRGLDVVAAPTLAALREHLCGRATLPRVLLRASATALEARADAPDLEDVRGQETVKRALEVAAAGGHNLLLVGAPGAGKTMMARRLPGILPPLTLDEALEATRVHSVVGGLPPGEALVRRRPFRAPHHTVSDAGLIGGGSPPRPGEVSLAHRGVLFLDELPEFRRHVLEVLRQPLEEGWVTVARARGSVRFPARFLLVAAMNPCPCGHHGDDRCTCDPGAVARYRGRISGPLLDRIDLHVPVHPVPVEALRDGGAGEGSEGVRARVVAARYRQTARFAGGGVLCNAEMGHAELRRHVRVDRRVARLLQQALDRLGLSARAYHRILKVARTIADLEGAEAVREIHAAEAIQYRGMDRAVR